MHESLQLSLVERFPVTFLTFRASEPSFTWANSLFFLFPFFTVLEVSDSPPFTSVANFREPTRCAYESSAIWDVLRRVKLVCTRLREFYIIYLLKRTKDNRVSAEGLLQPRLGNSSTTQTPVWPFLSRSIGVIVTIGYTARLFESFVLIQVPPNFAYVNETSSQSHIWIIQMNFKKDILFPSFFGLTSSVRNCARSCLSRIN